jgi:hypothetical protein
MKVLETFCILYFNCMKIMKKNSQLLHYDDKKFACFSYLSILQLFHTNLFIIQHNKCVNPRWATFHIFYNTLKIKGYFW